LGLPASAGNATPAPPAVIHPLVHRNTSDGTAQRFSSRFSGREFFIADHCINGHQVLPGVVQLEMACAAAVAAAGQQSRQGLRLRDIIWAHPVVVDESSAEIHISLVPQAHRDDRAGAAKGMHYEISPEPESGEGSYGPGPTQSHQRLVHSEGAVSLSAPTGASTLDLAGLRAEVNRDRLNAAQCYEFLRALGIRHGPSLQ